MEDNKLIAEFMGMSPHDHDGGCVVQMTHQGNEVVHDFTMKKKKNQVKFASFNMQDFARDLVMKPRIVRKCGQKHYHHDATTKK